MIDIKTVLIILGSLLTVGGAVVAFFQMQTRQNMKIEQLEKEVEQCKRDIADQSRYQIKTEKDVIEINGKLDHILASLEELKKQIFKG